MLKKFLLPIIAIPGLIFASPVISAPITVQSVLWDADEDMKTILPSSSINTTGDYIQNGDFTIIPVPSTATTVGDGIDEWTSGVFDFRSHPNYLAFSRNSMAKSFPRPSRFG